MSQPTESASTSPNPGSPKGRRFDETFKRDAVRLREQSGRPRAQVARDLARARQLWTQGALPRADLEKAQTESELARQAEDQAAARLQEARRGPRREVLEQARAQVQAARASLQGAEQTRRARLEELRDRPRAEDVQVARAQLDEARRGLEVARQRLAQGSLRAPFDGLILKKLAEPGDSVGPSQPVLAVSSWPQVEIRAQVDESNLGRLTVGQSARISAEASGQEDLEARITEIAPYVDPERGTVEIRLGLASSPKWLRPGQTVSVNILVKEAADLLVVPLQSVMALGSTWTVMASRSCSQESATALTAATIRVLTIRLACTTSSGTASRSPSR